MVECELTVTICRVLCIRSFNRYMVECECRMHPLRPFPLPVLIDTWWNVNIASINLNSSYRAF